MRYEVQDDGTAIKIEQVNGKEVLTALTADEYKAEIGTVEEEIVAGDEIVVTKKTNKTKSA